MEPSYREPNIFVGGLICSGKTTFADRISKHGGHTKIDIGDIVRQLLNSTTRTHNKDLDQAIIKELKQQLSQVDKAVVVGIRQPQILQAVLQEDDLCVWLDPEMEVLKERYEHRGAIKDQKLTFEQAIELDRELGIDKVKEMMNNHPNEMNLELLDK